MKIHMVSKGGLSKLHVCPDRGEGGSKIPKNPSTWFMDVPLYYSMMHGISTTNNAFTVTAMLDISNNCQLYKKILNQKVNYVN